MTKVIGIGASAGGLEAIAQLFDHLADDTGYSFVIIQHLSPDYKSLMPDLLAKHTKMNIYTAEDKQVLEPNCIYLNQSLKNLHVKGHRLYQLAKVPKGNLKLPIDLFFNSLGQAFNENSIGIILSGTGLDGSRGIKTIKECGGLVYVQAPETAQFDGMPNASIATDVVDFVMNPQEIGVAISRCPEKSLAYSNDGSKEDFFYRILEEINRLKGINFSFYKRNTLIRRMEKRIHIHQMKTLKEYFELCSSNTEECEALCEDFLIGVTSFFRDTDAYEALKAKVFPLICHNREAASVLRLWVPGCSSGEEAYSIAIALDQYITESNLNLEFKLFATDIYEGALRKAGQGIFNIDVASEMDSYFLEKYFVKNGDQLQIIKRIRDKILFSVNNVISDIPFIHIDLISCRNLLIYLKNEAKDNVIQNFLFSLNEKGFLFLGQSESLGRFNEDFLQIDTKHKLFQSLGHRNRLKGKMKVENDMSTYSSTSHDISFNQKVTESSFYRYISDHFGPSLIFIDSEYNIQFTKGLDTNKLKPKDGIFNTNILHLVDLQLATIIRNGVRRVRNDHQPVEVEDVALDATGIKVTTLRISEAIIEDEANPSFMLQFGQEYELKKPKKIEGLELSIITNQRIADLENELKAKNDQLKHLIEDLKASNEELQSANEELISSNEELQSANEELHSVNEELYTVNAELQEKHNELQGVYDDLNHLYDSQDIATLFLDKAQRIRSFTPALEKHLDLKESDIGRPIGNFMFFDQATRALFFEEIVACLHTGKQYEEPIRIDDAHYLLKIGPFRRGQETEGIVVTLIDVDDLIKTKKELADREYEYQLLFDHMSAGFVHCKIVTDEKGRPIDWEYLRINEAFANQTGFTNEVIGKRITEIFPGIVDEPADLIGKYGKVALEGGTLTFEHYLEGLDRHYDVHVFSPRKGEFAGVFTDISEKIKHQQALLEANERYKALFENISAGVALLRLVENESGKAADLIYEEVNSEYEDLLGIKRDVVIGKSIRDFSDSKEEDDFWINWSAETIRTGQPQSITNWVPNFQKHLKVYAYPSGIPGVIGYSFYDVTAEQEAELKIKAANTQLDLNMTLEKLAYWEWDAVSNQTVNYNQHWEALFEISPENVMDQLQAQIHEDHLPSVLADFEDHFAGKTAYFSHEYQYYSKDKSRIKWIKSTGQVTERGENGEPLKVVGSSRDITEEKEAGNAIKKAKEQYQSIFENINMGFAVTELIFNEDGKPINQHHIRVNEEFEKILGVKAHKILNQPLEVFDFDKLTISNFTNIASEVNESGQSKSFVRFFERFEKHLQIQVFPSGEKNRIGWAFLDITTKIEAEKEIKEINRKLEERKKFADAVTEYAASGIYIFDVQENKNTYSNRRAGKILGYTSQELKEMPSEEFMSHFHPEDLPQVLRHIETILTKQVPSKVTYRFRYKDGKYRTLLSHDAPFEFDEKGEVKSYLGSFVDISELQQKEEELIVAKNEAITANKQKDLFLSNLSHEIRTPMNSVIGFSRLLKHEGLTSEQKEKYIEQIEDNSKQLMTIIDDILSLSKMGSGFFELHMEAVDFHKMLRGIVDAHIQQLSDQSERKNLKIVLANKSPQSAIGVHTDVVRFSQVINNLLTNAVKYSKKGTIEVGYKLKKETIEVWVKDEGVGIKKNQLELIFQRFTQVEERLSDQVGGIGLGLAICKSIMDAFGGSIEVISTYRKGSTFTITMPYKPAQMENEPSHDITVKVKKIIVADDSASIQFYYECLLKNHDVTLLAAYDGEEVIHLLKEHEDVDLILMDMRMPEMDGPTALKNLRKFNKKVRVIGQSSFALKEQIEKFKAQGFEEYLTKPVDADKLLALLKE